MSIIYVEKCMVVCYNQKRKNEIKIGLNDDKQIVERKIKIKIIKR